MKEGDICEMNVTEYQYGNAIIKVYRPKLTQGERESREIRVKNALHEFGKTLVKGESK